MTTATIRGVSLELHPSPDYVSDHIRSTGDFYEIAILEEVERRLRGVEPGLLVDVGAMIGNHTTFLAAFVPHTGIHSFEPAPLNRQLLEKNVARYPEVTVHPVALSDREGRVAMAIAPDNRGWSTIKATEPNLIDGMGEFTALSMPLDSFRLADIRLLKIDVEHHEPQVLAGARETIARCRPLIVIEDWTGGTYASLLPGYRVAVSWQHQHQTYLYEWA